MFGKWPTQQDPIPNEWATKLNVLINAAADWIWSLYSKLSEYIHFHVKDGFPLKIVYELDSDHDNAKMVFFIAPKIDE